MKKWPIQTAEKEVAAAFENMICQKAAILNTYRIVIWGASVRGTLLGFLLEKAGRFDFEYVDNDEDKWESNINGHIILSPDTIRKYLNEIYIFVSIEYGNEIREQLLAWGMEEERNFTVLCPDTNEEYVKEFLRDNTECLIMGESFLNGIVLEERIESLKESIWRKYGKESTKILAVNCMGMQAFYHILRLYFKLKGKPKQFYFFVNYETLTEHHHLLSRTQHPDLLKMIYKQINIVDTEFDGFIKLAEECSHNYKLETAHSPKRIMDEEWDAANVQKEYLKQNIMYNLSTDTKEFIYFQKILQLLKGNQVKTYIIMTPINYQLAIQYYGQQFVKILDENNEIIKAVVGKCELNFINWGYLLEANDFSTAVTINDGIYHHAMEKVVRELHKIDEREAE